MSTHRRLIWVPVIHTEADLGSLYEPIKQLHLAMRGKKGWRRHTAAIDQMWAAIQEEIDRLDLDHGKARLYQDGLPICGREMDIVRDVARAGSQNHQLLLELIGRGATLVGTESPDLLLKEHGLVRQHLTSLESAEGDGVAQRLRGVSEQMLEERDAFIADRISRTLQTGETGLAFLGLLHSLEGRLAPDIEVRLLGPASTLVRQQGGARRTERQGGQA